MIIHFLIYLNKRNENVEINLRFLKLLWHELYQISINS